MNTNKIVNNILGNKPRFDCNSKNKENNKKLIEYPILLDDNHVRYGKSVVFAYSPLEAIEKAKKLYPRCKKVSVQILDDDEY